MSISHQDFLDELNREVEWLKNGATSYRAKTAELSLIVARQTESFELFSNKESTLKLVSEFLLDIDSEREKDIAKMLHTIYATLELEMTTPEDVKKMLFERKKKRNEKLTLASNI